MSTTTILPTEPERIASWALEQGFVPREFTDGTYYEFASGEGKNARTLRIGLDDGTVRVFVLDHRMSLLGSSTLTGWMARLAHVQMIARDAVAGLV
jgi:hypothetical protein